MFSPVISNAEQYNRISFEIEKLDKEIDRFCAAIYYVDTQMREVIGLQSEIIGCKLGVLRKFLELQPESRDVRTLMGALQKSFVDLEFDLTNNFESLLNAREFYVDAGRSIRLTDEKERELESKYKTHLSTKFQEELQKFSELIEGFKEKDVSEEEEGQGKEEAVVAAASSSSSSSASQFQRSLVEIEDALKRTIQALEEEFNLGNETFIEMLDSKTPFTYEKIFREETQGKLLRERRDLASQKVDNIFAACQVGVLSYVQTVCRAYSIARKRTKFLNRPNEDGFRPLHFAAYHCHPAIVTLLLEFNANPNAPDKAGYQALHWAAKAGDCLSVRILLEGGADKDAKGEYGRTPMHMAAFNHRLQVLDLLLQKGAYPNMRAEKGKTPLHEAVIHGDLEVARKLLQNKTLDVTMPDDENRTALWHAVADGLTHLIPLILIHSSWKNPEDEKDINHMKQLAAMDIRYNADEVRKSLCDYYLATHSK